MSKQKKKVVRAPLPAKKAAVKKVASKTGAKRTVRAGDGPTVAEYEALEKRNQELLERGRKVSHERDEMRQRLADAEQLNTLLSAGLDGKWTDLLVRGAFANADIEQGPLGACLAVIEGEIRKAGADAETFEESGKPGQMAGAVGACRRLRKVKAHIVELYERANGLGDWEEPLAKRTSRL